MSDNAGPDNAGPGDGRPVQGRDGTSEGSGAGDSSPSPRHGGSAAPGRAGRFDSAGRGGRGGRAGRGGDEARGGRTDRDGRRGYGGRPQRGGRGGPDGGERPARGGPDAGADRQGGRRLAPREPRRPDPAIPEDVTGRELDRSVRQQLRTLSKENAEGVAQHLVMVAALLDADDLEGAEAHAETAVRRAGRVPAAREALGMVAYRKGDWARALSEFRTVRRLSGSSHLLPLMADCERGLGRPERALEVTASPEAETLSVEERIELAIVVSGIRRDLGQLQAAVVALQVPQLTGPVRSYSARLYYAYADALLASGDTTGARQWFSKALEADRDLQTDAADRLNELDGVTLVDLLAEDDEADDESV